MKIEDIKKMGETGLKHMKAKSKALKMKTGYGKESDGEIKCKGCGKMKGKCSCK